MEHITAARIFHGIKTRLQVHLCLSVCCFHELWKRSSSSWSRTLYFPPLFTPPGGSYSSSCHRSDSSSLLPWEGGGKIRAAFTVGCQRGINNIWNDGKECPFNKVVYFVVLFLSPLWDGSLAIHQPGFLIAPLGTADWEEEKREREWELGRRKGRKGTLKWLSGQTEKLTLKIQIEHSINGMRTD